jgi:hypothetical protein
MKIGILTFHLGPNYGGYHQAFSLADTVRGLGHEVEIINYKNRVHWKEHQFKPWVYRRPLKLWHDFRKNQAFNRAYSRFTLSPFSTDPKMVDWNAYDAIIVGSDIVWNCESHVLGRDPVYFGQFPVAYRGRLIAYAPSTGYVKPDYAAPSWVAEGLKRFHAISVRDRITQKFVENQTGRQYPLVADPTWLVNSDMSDSNKFPKRTARNYLLVYSFPLQGEMTQSIRSFAKANGLMTVAVGYYQNWVDRNWPDVDVFEWIHLFRQAAYVVTGTFHGTLFSLREQARFCVLSNPAIDHKVIIPLEISGLRDRQTSSPGAIGSILERPIDYQIVNDRREEYARTSLDYLKKALQ